MNNDFLNNGLGSILSMYRNELEFKLLTLDERKSGKTIKHNTKQFLEVDLRTRSEIQDRQVKGSVLTINEVRIMEGRAPVKNGDEIIVPSNYMFLSQRDMGTANKTNTTPTTENPQPQNDK